MTRHRWFWWLCPHTSRWTLAEEDGTVVVRCARCGAVVDV